ncbi:fumarylacetoacetate hydrolase family protein [Roseomonas sp. AR75]|uniref:fumarylacetoacetate hydrolase family protein n=1 Tax=Roseomonas sp. AR75 TaxID=2562311 RepID=UPI0010BFED96|nr:fumarylacetoacetate hydrolase family protein [Roseomonas sp. AR75]
MIRLASFLSPGDVRPRFGAAEGDTLRDLTAAHGPDWDMVRALRLTPAELRDFVAAGSMRLPLAHCHLLPPVPVPGKIFCVGKNSKVHRQELVREGMLKEDPQEPTGFVKLVETMVGEGARVVRPEGISTFDYEPELAFIVTRRAHRVPRERAREYVGAITVLNDLTAREIQKQEVVSGTKFWTSKNMPGFCPVGPYAVPLSEIADPYDLFLTCAVNGQQRLRVSTDEYIHRIEGIIAHFTRFMPFEAGDVIATGAPRGTAIGHPNAAELYLKPGDVCVAGLEGVMQLTTRIVAPGEA